MGLVMHFAFDKLNCIQFKHQNLTNIIRDAQSVFSSNRNVRINWVLCVSRKIPTVYVGLQIKATLLC